MDSASFLLRFFAAYDCGAYGAGSYNSDQVCTTAGPGGLAGTGTDVILGVGIGLTLIIIGVVLIVILRRKRNKKP